MSVKHARVQHNRDFWALLAMINTFGPAKLELLRQLIGFDPVESEGPTADSRLLWYHQFVIPNETRWQCRCCGRCCASLEGPDGQSTPCEHLERTGRCGNYDRRGVMCRQFPYAVLDLEPWGSLLLISEVCDALGDGPRITPQQYNRLLVEHRGYAETLRQELVGGHDRALVLCFHYDLEQQRWRFSNTDWGT